MTDNHGARTSKSQPLDVHTTFISRLRRRILGAPRDLGDKTMYHAIALTPLLAWVGLGSDAVSSSAYGPEESFKALGVHRSLAVALALATAFTVTLIGASYAKLIEHFPKGGGYGVASRTLGKYPGLVSGTCLCSIGRSRAFWQPVSATMAAIAARIFMPGCYPAA